MKLLEIADLKLAYHAELNPKLWGAKDVLKPKVKEQLLKVVQQFVQTLEISPEVILDYVLTGSNANYNWTDSSDVDLHVLLRPGKCKTCKVEPEDCLHAKKTLWNDRHDVTIYGLPVEVYVTSRSEQLVKDSGTYSLTGNHWINEPHRVKQAIDSIQVRAKASEISKEIDQLISSKTDDQATIKALLNKIARLRQTGLEQSGEFSTENLAFKTLRNNGYIDKLKRYELRSQDAELSLS